MSLFELEEIETQQKFHAWKEEQKAIPKRVIVPVPPDDDDPFFDPTDPGLNPKEIGESRGNGYGKVTGLKGTGSKFKAKDRYPDAIKLLNQLHPGMYHKVERQQVTYTGQIVDVDWLGFLDILGHEQGTGRGIGCNVTTVKAMSRHICEWTDPSNTYSQAKTPVINLLRQYLHIGCLLYIIGYEQPGGPKTKWVYQYKAVTLADVEAAVGRKRR